MSVPIKQKSHVILGRMDVWENVVLLVPPVPPSTPNLTRARHSLYKVSVKINYYLEVRLLLDDLQRCSPTIYDITVQCDTEKVQKTTSVYCTSPDWDYSRKRDLFQLYCG